MVSSPGFLSSIPSLPFLAEQYFAGYIVAITVNTDSLINRLIVNPHTVFQSLIKPVGGG